MRNHSNIVPVHDGKQFTWQHMLGTAEVSSFDGAWARVWNDAADEGFYVKSHATGIKKLFVLSDVQKDAEGDVVSWDFVSYPDPAVKVRIFND